MEGSGSEQNNYGSGSRRTKKYTDPEHWITHTLLRIQTCVTVEVDPKTVLEFNISDIFLHDSVFETSNKVRYRSYGKKPLFKYHKYHWGILPATQLFQIIKAPDCTAAP